MRPKAALLLIGALASSFFLLAGCGQDKAGDGLSKEETQLGQKSDQIIKAANGSWDNLSAEDKEYLIKEIGYGNERNARMFFDAKSGNLKGGGPPGGPGGGATTAPR